MTSHAGADLVAELSMHLEPGAIVAPGAKGLIGRLPMRHIVGHQTPGTASAQHLLETIEDLPHQILAGGTASRFWWQQGSQDRPLLVAEIRGVAQAPGRHRRFSVRVQDQSWTEATERPLYTFLNSLSARLWPFCEAMGYIMPLTGVVAPPTRLRGPAQTGWFPGAPASVLRTPGDQPVWETPTAPIRHAAHLSPYRRRSRSIGPSSRQTGEFSWFLGAEDSAGQSRYIIRIRRGSAVAQELG
jgi:hypothetical protein